MTVLGYMKLQIQCTVDSGIKWIINPIPIGLFFLNIDGGGGGVFQHSVPYDVPLRVEIGDCDTCP